MPEHDRVLAAHLRRKISHRRRLPNPFIRRALRKDAGLTLADIADAVGVTAAAVSRWELGRRAPRGEVLERYLRVLDDLRRLQ